MHIMDIHRNMTNFVTLDAIQNNSSWNNIQTAEDVLLFAPCRDLKSHGWSLFKSRWFERERDIRASRILIWIFFASSKYLQKQLQYIIVFTKKKKIISYLVFEHIYPIVYKYLMLHDALRPPPWLFYRIENV